MNKIYRVIWNRTFNRFVVVNEFTQSRGKTTRLSAETDEGVLEHFSESFKAKLLPVVGAMLLALGLSTGGGKAYARVIGVEGETQTTDLSSLQIKDENHGVIDENYAFNPFYWDDYKTSNQEAESGYIDNKGIDQTVHVKGNHTLTGEDWSRIKAGNNGWEGTQSIKDLLDEPDDITIEGTISYEDGTEDTYSVDSLDKFNEQTREEFDIGNLSSVTFHDEVTGKEHTANVYQNFGFTGRDIATTHKYPVPKPADEYDGSVKTGSGQYVDKVFFDVSGANNALTVRVGQKDAGINATANAFEAKLKSTSTSSEKNNTSSVFKASDGASVVYDSVTAVKLSHLYDTPTAGGSASSNAHYVMKFSGQAVEMAYYVYEKFTYNDDGELVKTETQKVNKYDEDTQKALTESGWIQQKTQDGQAVVEIGTEDIHDIEGLTFYNKHLISQLGQKTDTGSKDETWYLTEFNKAIVLGTETVRVEYGENSKYFIPDGDSASVNASQQTVSYIHADDGFVQIKDGAQVYLRDSVASLIRVDADPVADQPHASATPNLRIQSGGTVGVEGGWGWVINSHGGYVLNEGEVDIGTHKASTNPDASVSIKGLHLENRAYAENKGLINYGSWPTATAVELQGGSKFVNASNGLVSLWVNDLRAPNIYEPDVNEAITVEDGSVFVNKGAVVAGMSALTQEELKNLTKSANWQETLSDRFNQTTDPESYLTQTIAVDVTNGSFTNEGYLASGYNIRGNTLVEVGGVNATFTNAGTMELFGRSIKDENGKLVGNGNAKNVGIEVLEGATQVENKGNILLAGDYLIGMHVVSQNGAVTKATNSGTITVDDISGDDEDASPNYAIWAEGKGVEVTHSGKINLNGDRAIGLHARGGAVIDAKGGELNFGTGSGQIGYLIYGEGSTIKVDSNKEISVKATDSTIYRVDTGATMNLTSGNLSASGKDSSIVTVTGKGASFTAENQLGSALSFNVSDGASALKVTGQATAYWKGNIGVSVSGKDSAVAVIDGHYIDIESGQTKPDEFYASGTTLINEGLISRNNVKDGAVAFIVNAGGTLTNSEQGKIDFSLQDGTQGDEMQGVVLNGGSLNNQGTILTHGIAVEVKGENSVLNNVGTIAATGASNNAAAVYLSDGATLTLTGNDQGKITASGTAHGVFVGADNAEGKSSSVTIEGGNFEMLEGTGSLIENRSSQAVAIKGGHLVVDDGKGIHSEKISFTDNASVTLKVKGKGTALVHEQINSDGTAAPTSEDLNIVNGVVIKAGAGTGVLSNTTGAVTLAGRIEATTGTGIRYVGQTQDGSLKLTETSSIKVAGGKAIDISVHEQNDNQLGELNLQGKITASNGGTAVAGQYAKIKDANIGGTIDATGSTALNFANADIAQLTLAMKNSTGAAGLEAEDALILDNATLGGVFVIAEGTVIDATNDAISAEGLNFSGKFENKGTITATNLAVDLSNAKNLTNLTNAGTIQSRSDVALKLNGASGKDGNGAVISNTGTIQGNQTAVSFDGGAVSSLTNDLNASIVGGVDGQKLTSSVEVTNKGKLSDLSLVNEDNSTVGHQVALHGGSEAQNIITSTGNDAFKIVDLAADQSKPFTKLDAGSGTDSLIFEGSEFLLNSEAVKNSVSNFEKVDLTKGSALTVVGSNNLFNLGSAVVGDDSRRILIDETSELSLVADRDDTTKSTFEMTLGLSSGIKGVVNITGSDANDIFTFSEDSAGYAGTNFLGLVNFENISTTLVDATATALQKAQVTLGSGSKMTVGHEEKTTPLPQNLASLSINQGELVFDQTADIFVKSPDDRLTIEFSDSKSKITTQSLDVGHTGTVTVHINVEGKGWHIGDEATNRVTAQTLMEQDEGTADIQLIQSVVDGVKGDASKLTLNLINENGGTINPSEFDYSLDGKSGLEDVATAYYNYHLSTSNLGWQGEEIGKDDGLYISKQLERIHLTEKSSRESGQNQLVEITGNADTTRGNELHALLYGEGGFEFSGIYKNDENKPGIGSGLGIIKNGENAFTGEVLISLGTLALGESNSLGAEGASYAGTTYGFTKQVSLNADTGFQLGLDKDDKVSQTVGSLDAAENSVVQLNSGSLTIDGGDLSHSIAGDLRGIEGSKLTLNAGTLTIVGAQDLYHGTTTLDVAGEAAKVVIDSETGLGDEAVKFNNDGDVSLAELLISNDSLSKAFNLQATVEGNGLVNVNGINGQTFSFDTQQKLNALTGELRLTDAKYSLTELLKNAHLNAQNQSVVMVDDQRSVDTLTIGNNSEFQFGHLSVGASLNQDAIQISSDSSNDLTIGNGSQKFVINGAEGGMATGGQMQIEDENHDLAEGAYSLLDQDDQGLITALLDKVNAPVDPSSIKVVGKDGNAITHAQTEFTNGENKIATGIYALGSEDDPSAHLVQKGDQVGIEFKLSEIIIEGGQSITLDASETTLDTTNTLSAKISEVGGGSGSVLIRGNKENKDRAVVTIANGDNSFSGKATVEDGITLKLGADNALGSLVNSVRKYVSEVALGASSIFDLDNHNQTVGSVTGGGQVDIGQGQLTISGSGAPAGGSLIGSVIGEKHTDDTASLRIGTAEKTSVTVNGPSESYSGITSVEKGSTLELKDVHALGGKDAGDIRLSDNSLVKVSNVEGKTDPVDFNNKVTGVGALTVVSGTVELVAENDFTGDITVGEGGTAANVTANDNGAGKIGLGDIIVNTGSSLTLTNNDAWDLAGTTSDVSRYLSGQGRLEVIKSRDFQDGFNFKTNQGDQFTGTLALQNIGISLQKGNVNQTALSGATLEVGNNAIASLLGTERILIGGLSVVGSGRLDFSGTENVLGDRYAQNLIESASGFDFTQEDGGRVIVNLSGQIDGNDLINKIDTKVPLLDQDNQNHVLHYLGLGKVTGDASNLDLVVENNSVLQDATYQFDIAQKVGTDTADTVVAHGFYGLGLGSDNQGFGVSYGLQKVEILDGKTLTLYAGKDNELSAQVTEEASQRGGSLTIAQGQAIRLTNNSNEFSGVLTLEDKSTLTIKSGALGQTDLGKHVTQTIVSKGATLNVGDTNTQGVTQTIGGLNVQNGGTLSLNNGAQLTLDQNSNHQIVGLIKGDEKSTLVLARGKGADNRNELHVTADSGKFEGLAKVGEFATLVLDEVKGLGTGLISLLTKSSNLEMTSDIDWTMQNVIQGNGEVHFTGTGTNAKPQFAFKSVASDDNFSGTLFLDNAALTLASVGSGKVNADELANASINLSDSRLELRDKGNYSYAIKDALLSNSTIVLDGVNWDTATSNGWLSVDNLTLEGKTTLNFKKADVLATSGKNLLEQDDGFAVKVVQSKNSVTTEQDTSFVLTLGDETKEYSTGELFKANIFSLENSTDIVAEGTYQLTGITTQSNQENGLFVSSELLNLDLKEDKTLILRPAQDAQGTARELKASLQGKGNILVQGDVALTNDGKNLDYLTTFTGKTTVDAGNKLTLATDWSLGQSNSHTSLIDLTRNAAKLIVSEDTQQAAGNVLIDNGGSIELKENSALTLDGVGQLTGEMKTADALTGNGTLIVEGNGTKLVIDLANTSFTGATEIGSGTASSETPATIVLNEQDALGSSTITLNTDGVLELNNFAGTFDNQFTGSGELLVRGCADAGSTNKITLSTGRTLADVTSNAFTGTLHVTDQGYLKLATLEEFGSYQSVAQVDANSTLDLSFNDAWTFDNYQIAGDGTVIMASDATANQIVIGETSAVYMGDKFEGIVSLQNATMTITGQAQDGNFTEEALKNTTLEIGQGGRFEVSDVKIDGIQHQIGGLSFGSSSDHDATFVVKDIFAPGAEQYVPLKVSNLDVHGVGTVEINLADNYDVPEVETDPDHWNTIPLLEQDDGDHLALIVETETQNQIMGSGANLTPEFYQNGQLVSSSEFDDIQMGILQGSPSEEVATGFYGYRFDVSDADDSRHGLYLSYGLKEVSIHDQKELALIAANVGKDSQEFTALITEDAGGVGSLLIGGDLAITLSNAANAYSGKTTVAAGSSLIAGNNNVLGQTDKHTSELALQTNGSFDLNGFSQTIGSLNTNAGSVVDLGDKPRGTDYTGLTIENGGTVAQANTLRGGEKTELHLTGGTLNINGANQNLHAQVDLSGSQTTAKLNSGSGLGDGVVSLAQGTFVNYHDTGRDIISNVFEGDGTVGVSSSSDLTLTRANENFKGLFDIDATSSLTASSLSTLGSSEIKVDGQGQLILTQSGDYEFTNKTFGTGNVTIDNAGGIVTVGTNFAHTGTTYVTSGGIKADPSQSGDRVLASSVNLSKSTTLEGFNRINGSLTNAGTVFINYSGQTGDKTKPYSDEQTLTVMGDYHANGGTLHFYGALATDDNDSILDTMLIKGDADGQGKVKVEELGGVGGLTPTEGITLITIEGNGDDLHLSQDGRIVAGAYDYVLLKDPDNQRYYLQSTAGEWPITPEVPVGPLVRPEIGSYMANAQAADIFEMRLHDRLGESHYVDPLTGELKETSMWMRQVASHNHFRMDGGKIRNHATRGLTQLGGDVIRHNDEGNLRAHVGLMAGVMYGKSSSVSSLSGNRSSGKTDGYGVGFYGTFFNGQGEAVDSGFYLDTWAQYVWLDNTVEPQDLPEENYDTNGLLASIEAGYTFHMGRSSTPGHELDWFIQPQAQVIYEGVDMGDHIEANGTRVSMTGKSNVKTRLGVRLQGATVPDVNNVSRGQGFLELNWIRNSQRPGVVMNGVEFKEEGAKHLGEFRIGMEGQMTENLHGFISGGIRAGGSGWHEETLNVGLKYTF